MNSEGLKRRLEALRERRAKIDAEIEQLEAQLEAQERAEKKGSEALKETARLEDLTLWQMEKTKSTKKGSKTYLYWMVSWREGDKVRNVHLGSCRKMDHETALQKARKLKAESLAIQT